MEENMDDKRISTKRASKILGVSVSTVSRWFDQGILTGEKNPLTSWRKISMESIENLLKNFNLPLPKEEKKPTRIITTIPLPKEEEPKLEVDEKRDTN
jgi:hypothetical protein